MTLLPQLSRYNGVMLHHYNDQGLSAEVIKLVPLAYLAGGRYLLYLTLTTPAGGHTREHCSFSR